MEAVVVTFYFNKTMQPAESALETHQALLDRLPGLRSNIALRNGAEYAFLLTFEEATQIDEYLDRPEVRGLARQPGCYDVFVNRFDVVLPEVVELTAGSEV